ncbi:MAG: diguanylate cyclase domain-containing protein, partial [Paracoccaceae bacterium]
RVGGDEFVLLYHGLIDQDRLSKIANRIIRELEQPIDFQGTPCRISGSIGFTVSRFYDPPDADRMLSDADIALYASKHQGRAQSTMVTPELLARAAQNGGDAPGAPERRTR